MDYKGPNPFREQRLVKGSFRARQARIMQAQRLKAMNAEFRSIKKNYTNFTTYKKPSMDDIERKFPIPEPKERTRANLFERKVRVRPMRTVKNVAEEVLSNYNAGRFSDMDKNIERTYFVRGYYL